MEAPCECWRLGANDRCADDDMCGILGHGHRQPVADILMTHLVVCTLTQMVQVLLALVLELPLVI